MGLRSWWRSKFAPEKKQPRRQSHSFAHHRSAESDYDLQALPAEANTLKTPVSETLTSLNRLRAQSRWLKANSALARQAQRIIRNGIIGTTAPVISFPGIARAHSERLSKAFAAWSADGHDNTRPDWYGQHGLFALLTEMLSHYFQDGGAFLRVREGANFKIEVIDPPRIPTYIFSSADTSRTLQGAILDEQNRIIAWIVNPSPFIDRLAYRYPVGQELGRNEIVPASEILRFYDPDKQGEIHGLPPLCPAIPVISSQVRFMDAAVKQSEIGARIFAAVQRHELDILDGEGIEESGKPAEPEDPSVAVRTIHSDPQVRMLETSKSDSIVPLTTRYPDKDSATFFKMCAQQIAAALGIAYHNLTADLTGTSFSGGRLGEIEQAANLSHLRTMFEEMMFRPLIKRWLTDFVRHHRADAKITDGRVLRNAMNEIEIRYSTRAPIEPVKHAQATEIEIRSGTQSVTGAIRAAGRNPDMVAAEREKEKETMAPPEPPPTPPDEEPADENPDANDQEEPSDEPN